MVLQQDIRRAILLAGAKMTRPLITAALNAPKTHKVVTTYADGRVREFETRSELTAANHAVLDRRNIGRDLISRETGQAVRIVSVEVKPI